jgi:hypothetical protein
MSELLEEVFYGEGEPYQSEELCTNRKGLPTSVWSAIKVFHDESPKEWDVMALKLWNLNKRQSHLLMCEAVIAKIRSTAKCDHEENYFDAWVDPEGRFKVRVWR